MEGKEADLPTRRMVAPRALSKVVYKEPKSENKVPAQAHLEMFKMEMKEAILKFK